MQPIEANIEIIDDSGECKFYVMHFFAPFSHVLTLYNVTVLHPCKLYMQNMVWLLGQEEAHKKCIRCQAL